MKTKDSHTTLVKVDVPNLVTYFNQTPILELYVVRYGSEDGYGKDIFSKEFCTMCSNSANYFRLDRQHSMRGVKETYTTI